MIVSIRRSTPLNPDSGPSVAVEVDGTSRRFATKEAAYEHLSGLQRELKSAIDTAKEMFEITG